MPEAMVLKSEEFGEKSTDGTIHIIYGAIVTRNQIDMIVLFNLKKGQGENDKPNN